MRHILVLIVLLAADQASAQLLAKADRENIPQVFENNSEWLEGSILLNDGTADKGHVKYNSITGIVSFESNANTGSYNARNLTGFKFLDTQSRQRQFYSIPYRSPSGVVKQFFEVVREYKDFAVISQTSMLSQKSSSEITTLYFMRASDLTVMPFLEVMDRDVKWRIFDANKTQVRVLDSDLPKNIMGENFARVKAFAKERKLVWHVKDSLISILDYYDSIAGQ